MLWAIDLQSQALYVGHALLEPAHEVSKPRLLQHGPSWRDGHAAPDRGSMRIANVPPESADRRCARPGRAEIII